VDDILYRAEQFQNLSIKQAQAHYDAAERFARRNIYLGGPVTIATTIVATATFATLAQSQMNVAIVLMTGSLSIGAAVLSGLQTFLRYADLSGEHRRAAGAFGTVKRSLDLFALEFKQSADRAAALKALGIIVAKIDSINESAPVVPTSLYKTVQWRPDPNSDFTSSTSRPLPLTTKGEAAN
jgi:hypothetical protein